MTQPIETLEIPVEVRKLVYTNRLARSAGYLVAITAGLLTAKLPVRNVVVAVAVLGGVEVITSTFNAYDDEYVTEQAGKENFGTVQSHLEAAGTGLGLGFAVVAAAVIIKKLLAKKEDSDGQ